MNGGLCSLTSLAKIHNVLLRLCLSAILIAGAILRKQEVLQLFNSYSLFRLIFMSVVILDTYIDTRIDTKTDKHTHTDTHA